MNFRYNRRIACLLVMLLLPGCSTSPAPAPSQQANNDSAPEKAGTSRLSRFEFTQPHMGTRFRIVLYAADEETAKKAADSAFQRVAQLDDIMSDYKDTSELMRLCRQAGGEPVKVSPELLLILTRSQELAQRTGGAFDVTVGPLTRLWRRARRQRELPDLKRLAEALELVGYDKVRLDVKAGTVHLLKKGMLLDLGGIAKGYAADEALAVLKRHGIRGALIAASGDIAVSEPPPGSDGWTIGIAPLDSSPPLISPLMRGGKGGRHLLLHNAAVSTSGDAEQFVEIGGKRYSHIVDPKTGLGLVGHSSVTVVGPDGTTSDSLVTAVSVLGPKKGLELIDASEGTAALILRATDSGVEAFESKRWKDIPKTRAEKGEDGEAAK